MYTVLSSLPWVSFYKLFVIIVTLLSLIISSKLKTLFEWFQAGKELSEKKSQEFQQLLSSIESYMRYQLFTIKL